MELSFWAATDVGKKREINEDNFLVDKKLSLFVVADGMGGHASGEVASKLAVHEFRNAVEGGRDAIDKFAKGDPTVRPQDVLILLGDQFLLCSDGLHFYLNDARIVDMLKGDDVKALPKKLIDMANAGGGHDNITAVVVRIEKPTVAAGTVPPADDRAEELARKV